MAHYIMGDIRDFFFQNECHTVDFAFVLIRSYALWRDLWKIQYLTSR